MNLNNKAEQYFNFVIGLLRLERVSFFIWVLVIIAGIVLWSIIYRLVRFYLVYRQSKQEYTIFEIQPLRTTEKNPYTTEQLFAIIHGLAREQSFWYRFFRINKAYSFEIVSTKKEGIKYLVRVNLDDADIIKKSLLSYLPGISIKESKDYLPASLKNKTITSFELAKDFIFPLKQQQVLEKHDPIAYLTGSMTKLSENELISFQLIVSPVSKFGVPEIRRTTVMIASDQDVRQRLKNKGKMVELIRLVARVVLPIILLPVGLLVYLLTDGRDGPFLMAFFDRKQKTNSDPYQQELRSLVKNKLDQPLFTVSIKLLVAGNTLKEEMKNERGFVSALASFTNSDYQSLVRSKSSKFRWMKDLKRVMFGKRILNPLSKVILSTAEVAGLYHFPFARTTKTEDLLKQHSKELPAPLALKQTEDLDVVFAKNCYGGSTTLIGLTVEERRRHMYILGATGTGKTTMLLSMIDSDLKNGKGMCVIDPHGDLIEDVLSLIPEERVNDVVYFNPDDISYPIGINLLELTPGLKNDEVLKEKEFITESIISLFHKIYSEKYSGPRMEYILRNTIYTAFTIPGATLFTVYKLLINTPFRKGVVAKLEDESLKDFWRYEFAKAGDYQKVSMIGPITNKIGRFLFSPSAKRILEQEKSTIDFSKIMDSKKILLCNLSKGKIGEDSSEVLGVVIMAKLQLAALKRARVKIEKRTDFYLYVDEFQNFATPAFAQILSEARKYRLSAILAHQTTSQLEDKSLVNVTLANTGTVVCFRTANPEDEKLILPQFQPYIEKGEIASLPSYRFYMRLGAINPQEPFSGITVPVLVRKNKKFFEKIISASRRNFAIKYEEKKSSQSNIETKVFSQNLLP